MARDSKEAGAFILQLLEVCVFYVINYLILECLVHRSHFSYILHLLLFWSCGWYRWSVVVFGITMGYTPGSVMLFHAVVERVVYSCGFIMMPMCLWCTPPCCVVRLSALAYRSCIVSFMASYSGSPLILGIILMVNLSAISSNQLFFVCHRFGSNPRTAEST